MKVLHTCRKCGKEFLAYLSNKRNYCSSSCGRTSPRKIVVKPPNQICKRCKTHFYHSSPRVFCSFFCFSHDHIMSTSKCLKCKKEFTIETRRSETNKWKMKYCSHKCSYAHMRPPHYSGEKSSNWKGGKSTTSQGYIKEYSPSNPNCDCCGYVLQHRLIAEKYLGRFLKSVELVHHINEIKTDNRPENLYLFSDRGEHTRYHHNNNYPLISNIKQS